MRSFDKYHLGKTSAHPTFPQQLKEARTMDDNYIPALPKQSKAPQVFEHEEDGVAVKGEAGVIGNTSTKC